MTIKEKSTFNDFLRNLAEASGKKFTSGLLEIYWLALQDKSLEEIKTSAIEHVKDGKGFPDVSVLRGGNKQREQLELEAVKAYNTIREVMDALYGDELGGAGVHAIRLALEDKRQTHLFLLVQKWGLRILDDSNPSATYAQFRDEYKILAKTGQLKELPPTGKRFIIDKGEKVKRKQLGTGIAWLRRDEVPTLPSGESDGDVDGLGKMVVDRLCII